MKLSDIHGSRMTANTERRDAATGNSGEAGSNPKEGLLLLQKKLVRHYITINYGNCDLPLKPFLQHLEKDLIKQALRICHGHQRHASELLNLKPTCLNVKIKKYKIGKAKRAEN